MPDTTTRDAVSATLAQAREPDQDFPGWLALVLASVAAEPGFTEAIVASRAGSWGSAPVLLLVCGTVGGEDEHLGTWELAEATATAVAQAAGVAR